MSFPLPQEILTEILARLRVKSLLRFRSVSRSWNSLITSQKFIDLHLSRSIEAHDPLIIISEYNRQWGLYTFYRDNGGSLTEDQELVFPINTDTQYYYVSTCKGLLCLTDYDDDNPSIVLWNPSIRTCFQLPIPGSIDDGNHLGAIGFGFDCWTNQYKVLRINSSVLYRPTTPPSVVVEVFVLGTNKWRRVNTHVPYRMLSFDNQATCVHNAIHRIGYKSNDSMVIVVFDVHEEVFRDIEFPSSIVVPYLARLSVTAYKESLCLVELSVTAGSYMLFIWVMKQYGVKESWIKLFSIDMEVQRGLERVLGFRKHGKILGENVRQQLVSYEPKSGMVELLVVHRKQAILVPNDNDEIDFSYRDRFSLLQVYGFDKAIPHMESLVLLKGTNGLD